MITIYNAETNVAIGELREGEIQFMLEASPQKTDGKTYVVTPQVVADVDAAHGDKRLIEVLQFALGDAEEVMIRWEHD